MPAPGPYELSPVFLGEDVGAVVTLAGSGSIAGMTFLIEIDNAAGADVLSSALAAYVNITNAEARQVTWSTNGLTMAAGTYYWKLRRTNGGARTVCAYGWFRVRSDAER